MVLKDLDSFENNTDNKISEARVIQSEFNHSSDVLCRHCKRTATNGLGCLGICVADSEY